MLNINQQDARDLKIAELQKQLFAFQAFIGSYLIAQGLERIEASPPDPKLLEKGNLQLILKTETDGDKKILVAELIRKVDH